MVDRARAKRLAVPWTGVRARVRPVSLLLRLATLASCVLAAVPTSAEGQLGRLLQAVKEGGGWARFSVEEGRGGYRSAAVPVAGLSLDGCFQVVQPATGTWTLTARDLLGDGRIEATVGAGEPVRFSYEAGFRTQLDVVVEWSEPRDTTLVVWIGLETLAQEGRDVCQPPGGQRLQAGAGGRGRRLIAVGAGRSMVVRPASHAVASAATRRGRGGRWTPAAASAGQSVVAPGSRPGCLARRSLHAKQAERTKATAAAATTMASTTAGSQARPVIRSR